MIIGKLQEVYSACKVFGHDVVCLKSLSSYCGYSRKKSLQTPYVVIRNE